MAKVLSLYGEDKRQAIQTVVPEEVSSECRDCQLHENANTICMPPRGQPGGLLVVDGYPAAAEDRSGKSFGTKSGQFVTNAVKKYWDGPFAVDYAVKCAPRKSDIRDKHIVACRQYAAAVLEEVAPTRVILLGSIAYRSYLGRAPDPLSVRRGHTWLRVGGKNILVLLLPNVAQSLKNYFLAEALEQDLKWAMTCEAPELPPWSEMTCVVTHVADAQRAQEEALSVKKWVAFDCETSGKMFNRDFKLLSVAISFDDGTKSWVWDAVGLSCPDSRQLLIDILTNPTIPKCGQNVKFDIKAIYCGMKNLGCGEVFVTPIGHDTRLARRLLVTEAKSNLETMAELVGMGGHKDEAHTHVKEAKGLISKAAAKIRRDAKKDGIDLADVGGQDKQCLEMAEEPMAYAFGYVPGDVLNRYNALDTVTTGMLGGVFERGFDKNPDLRFVWDELVGPASEAFAQVEIWGKRADKGALETFIYYLEARSGAVHKAILKEAGDDFNPASTKQVAELLFGKLGLKPLKETKSGAPSTDAATLEALRHTHPVVDMLLEHRSVNKMLGTYGRGMLPHIREDGRVHPSFNLDGARSGRLSCDAPNLQNIPRAESTEGRMARDIFAAGPGNLLVSMDYSQLELRIAADLSGDKNMKDIFLEGVDYHRRTAELIAPIVWGITEQAGVTKAHRSAAKAFNFGILYGMSDKGIAERANCTVAVARSIRHAILGRFDKLDRWTKGCLAETKKTGYTYTSWKGRRARRRSLWQIGDKDDLKRATAEHGSWNTPVQGTASDYCLASVTAIVNWLLEDRFPAKLVSTVHDSVIFEVGHDYLDELVYTVRGIMEGWPTMHNIPLVVDTEVGKAWGSLETYQDCKYCGRPYYGKQLTCSSEKCIDAEEASLLLKGMEG